MRKILPVLIAKGESTRLPNKNRKLFNGKPLFHWNLLKLLNIFNEVIVDSDTKEILASASELGAIPHDRALRDRGNDVPSMQIFKKILEDFPSYDGILNVQANSPNVSQELINKAYDLISGGFTNHILTCNEDMSWNGSIWALTADTIHNTKDFYEIKPDLFLVDDSVDIHTQSEFDEALSKFSD